MSRKVILFSVLRGSHPVSVGGHLVDARQASDLIGKLSGKAYWRKLFVRRSNVDVGEARRICAGVIASG